MPYLFAHFREKLTVDGEQVYFAVSKTDMITPPLIQENP